MPIETRSDTCTGEWQNKLNSTLKARSVVFLRILVLFCAFSLFSVCYYTRYDDINTAVTAIITRPRGNKTLLLVEHFNYNFSSDVLRRIRNYGKQNNSPYVPSVQFGAQLEGTEEIQNKIDSIKLLVQKKHPSVLRNTSTTPRNQTTLQQISTERGQQHGTTKVPSGKHAHHPTSNQSSDKEHFHNTTIASVTKTTLQHKITETIQHIIRATTPFVKHKEPSANRSLERYLKYRSSDRFADGSLCFRISRQVEDVSCNKLFKGDTDEIARAKDMAAQQPRASKQIFAADYINMTTNCSYFIQNRGYITSPLTDIEADFPIAFSILMYKEIWQFERLLRAIYRPQNFYCLHVDFKTDESILKAVQGIAKCFDNVFITSKRFSVEWGEMTVLEPELSCMADLWNRSRTWKYFINLTGQEFPLRTNYELVRILTAYNGSNDVESTVRRANHLRWQAAGPVPHGLTPVKGSVHVVVSRGFVDAVLHDAHVQDLLTWTRQTHVPDEVFFATINHNPSLNVSGSYKGDPETDHEIKPFVARFKNWGAGIYNWPCAGTRVRMICVFGVGDLPVLVSRREMFANKFFIDFEHYALDCVEELHFNHTRDEYLGRLVFDPAWYANLGFVHNRVDL